MKKFGYFALAALIATSPAVAQAPSAADPDADKRVCKRFEVTGSLVKKKKVCKTKAEWLRSQMEAREATEKWQGKLCTAAECTGG